MAERKKTEHVESENLLEGTFVQAAESAERFGEIGLEDGTTDISAFRPGPDTLPDRVIATNQAYARIADLKEIAIDEGMEVSTDSEKDLRSFLASVEFTRRPYIALLDNGNFRAVWKNADREQIGLQFRGGGLIHYVFFALRSPGRFMAQAAGKDTLQNTRRQIDILGLGRLMTA